MIDDHRATGPDFLGIGAQKAGTTWLYETLAHVPDVAFPAGKEVHFWDQHRGQGIAWYQALFDDSPTRPCGEITPAYAILPDPVIGEVRAALPAVRLVYLLRNPIARAWSSALMALARAEMRPEEASDQWFIDHVRSQGSRSRGDYAACLRAWRAHYPAEQLMIGWYAEIARAPTELLRRVLAHIGAAPAGAEAVPEHVLTRRVHAGPEVAIRPAVQRELVRLYAEPIAELADLLLIDLRAWLAGEEGA